MTFAPRPCQYMKDNKFLATARNYELLFHPGGGGAMFHKLAPTKEQS